MSNKALNKSDLADLVKKHGGLSSKKDAEVAITAVIDALTEILVKNKKVSLVGFGAFEVSHRKARDGRNPQTGAKIKIKASKVPTFKSGKALKDKINK